MNFSLAYLGYQIVYRPFDFFRHWLMAGIRIFARPKTVETDSSRTFYFDDPRLRMTVGGRLVVRIVSYATYLILATTAFTFIISDVSWMIWCGVGLALLVMDRVLRRRAPDRRFSEMPASGAVNLGGHLEPAAFSMIERGYDRSVILRHDILPEITLQLLQVTEVKTLLSGLDVPPDEFRQKAEELFGKYRPAVAATGSQIGSVAELVVRAGEAALVSGHRAIGAEDVFLASLASAHPAIERLVAAFALGPSTLGQAPSFEGGDDEARVG